MIKVDLITGFLGSGKTTFIKEYARYLMGQGMKIGILENDYGAVNVDMMLLGELRGEQCELEMVAGGCDYDCHKRRFKTKLISMAMMGYQRILVEPSGIFDVDEFFDVLYEEPLDLWYEIGNVITIVDTTLERDLTKESDYLLACQVAKAGKIVFSRWNEATPKMFFSTLQYINEALASCKASRKLEASQKEQGEILAGDDLIIGEWKDFTQEQWQEIASCGYQRIDHVKQPVSMENTYQSLFFMNITPPLEGLKERLQEIFADTSCGRVFRIKGFIPQNEGGFWEINANQKGISLKPVNKGQEIVIVIGEKLQEEQIQKHLRYEIKEN